MGRRRLLQGPYLFLSISRANYDIYVAIVTVDVIKNFPFMFRSTGVRFKTMGNERILQET